MRGIDCDSGVRRRRAWEEELEMQKIKVEAGFVLSSREAKHFEITTILPNLTLLSCKGNHLYKFLMNTVWTVILHRPFLHDQTD